MPAVKQGVMRFGYGSFVLGLVGLSASAYGYLVQGAAALSVLALPLHLAGLGLAVLYSPWALRTVATDRPSLVLGLLALAGAGGLTNAAGIVASFLVCAIILSG